MMQDCAPERVGPACSPMLGGSGLQGGHNLAAIIRAHALQVRRPEVSELSCHARGPPSLSPPPATITIHSHCSSSLSTSPPSSLPPCPLGQTSPPSPKGPGVDPGRRRGRPRGQPGPAAAAFSRRGRRGRRGQVGPAVHAAARPARRRQPAAFADAGAEGLRGGELDG